MRAGTEKERSNTHTQAKKQGWNNNDNGNGYRPTESPHSTAYPARHA